VEIGALEISNLAGNRRRSRRRDAALLRQGQDACRYIWLRSASSRGKLAVNLSYIRQVALLALLNAHTGTSSRCQHALTLSTASSRASARSD